MNNLLIVALGGAIGSGGRHLVNIAAARVFGINFPWGTAIVNVTGSVIMGLVAGYFAFRASAGLPEHLRLFLTTGVLGGYTTFSAFSLDAGLLMERGAYGPAIAYIVGSVVISILGLFFGLWLIRAVI
jgi:CrcB protein